MAQRKRVVVLGCGLVGATIAKDFAGDRDYDVSVADIGGPSLARLDGFEVETHRSDLSDPAEIRSLVESADVVVGALPSTLGHAALRVVIESGKPYCDISFMIEDATELSELARDHGVTAVVDCGVAPGLANMAIGYSASLLDVVDEVVFYVGGLPERRSWPFEYKAPFAPADVLEEYVRPARIVVEGRVVERPALSDAELIDFAEIGTLEAFNTDGLRSLIHTIPARNMTEKTLRYPGHIELMRVLRETGFFSKAEIDVRGTRVRPLDVTSALLFPSWELGPNEREFTLLHVEVRGLREERPLKFTYHLFDEFDATTGNHSMARTTGFPCAIVARMLADGSLDRPGVHPPEVIAAMPGVYDRVIDELAARGVVMGASRDGD